MIGLWKGEIEIEGDGYDCSVKIYADYIRTESKEILTKKEARGKIKTFKDTSKLKELFLEVIETNIGKIILNNMAVSHLAGCKQKETEIDFVLYSKPKGKLKKYCDSLNWNKRGRKVNTLTKVDYHS